MEKEILLLTLFPWLTETTKSAELLGIPQKHYATKYK